MATSPTGLLAERARIRRDADAQTAAKLLETRDARANKAFTDSERVRFDSLLDSIKVSDDDYERFRKLTKKAESRARVTREPLTYAEANKDHSYFRDLMTVKANGIDAPEATARLARHTAEMRVEIPNREARANREMRRAGDTYGAIFERRVEPSRATGDGGSFAPPLWLVSGTYAGIFPRPARVIADLCVNLPLSIGWQSVNVPRITTANVVLPDVDATAVPGADLTDNVVKSQVIALAGQSDVSLQEIEQSPGNALDAVVWADLLNATDAQLESQIVNGNGAMGIGGQLPGLLTTVSAGTSVAFTASSPTGILAYPYIGQVFGAVSNNRKLAPEAYVIRGGFWAWLGTQLDGNNRPFLPPTRAAFDPMPTTNGPKPIGSLVGLPTYTSESITAQLGTASNQQAVLAVRPSDYLLWQGDPRLSADVVSLSGTLSVRIQIRRYVAFIGSRYGGTETGVLTGTGLVPTSTNF